MGQHRVPTLAVLGVALVAACNGRPVSIKDTDDGTATGSDSGDTGTDTDTASCEDAALEYRGVCFYSHSVEAMSHDHPLDLDGEPGHELVGVDDGVLSVHKWNGDGFDRVGEEDLPPQVVAPLEVVAGEFDDEPGLDLVASEAGEWAAVYHVDAAGAPAFVATTTMQSPAVSDRGFDSPVAVGPDDLGRWRVVAHRDDEIPELTDRLALWEMVGNTWSDERLELPTDACELGTCSGGDFDGDGRQDAVCTLMEYCADPAPEEDVVHVVLLAQADGSVTAAAYPTVLASNPPVVADIGGSSSPDLLWAYYYRLGDGEGGLLPTTDLSPPPEPGWNVVTAGILEPAGEVRLFLGDEAQGRIYADAVGQAAEFEEVTLSGAMFTPVAPRVLDVNGDGIVDIPARDRLVLVSEVHP